MGILSHDQILKLQEAILSARLGSSRSALLAGIPAGLVATLPTSRIPGDQVLTDLDAINDAGVLRDGSVPLAEWLKNALALAGLRTEAAVFRRALARCPAPASVPPPSLPPPASAPPRPVTAARPVTAVPFRPSPRTSSAKRSRAAHADAPPGAPEEWEPARAGLAAVYERLPDAHVTALFRRCKSEILLLQTWIGNMVSIKATFSEAARSGCRKIRVLLVHPRSVHTVERWKDYAGGSPVGSTGSIKGRVLANLDEMAAECGRDPRLLDLVEVRLYHATPVFAIYGTAESMYVGFFWQGEGALAAPQLLVRKSRKAILYERFLRHFDSLWEKSEVHSLREHVAAPPDWS